MIIVVIVYNLLSASPFDIVLKISLTSWLNCCHSSFWCAVGHLIRILVTLSGFERPARGGSRLCGVYPGYDPPPSHQGNYLCVVTASPPLSLSLSFQTFHPGLVVFNTTRVLAFLSAVQYLVESPSSVLMGISFSLPYLVQFIVLLYHQSTLIEVVLSTPRLTGFIRSKLFLTIDLGKRLYTANCFIISEQVWIHVWLPYETFGLRRRFRNMTKILGDVLVLQQFVVFGKITFKLF